MVAISPAGTPSDAGKIDILFPVLHGLHGEDGSVQGLAEVARVPLAGCGILGSAAALDKPIAKQLLRAAGLPVARAVSIVSWVMSTRFGSRSASSIGIVTMCGDWRASIGPHFFSATARTAAPPKRDARSRS